MLPIHLEALKAKKQDLQALSPVGLVELSQPQMPCSLNVFFPGRMAFVDFILKIFDQLFYVYFIE